MTAIPSRRPGILSFLRYALHHGTEGGPVFYLWMTLLTLLALAGTAVWADQVRQGLTITGLSDHVSWGLYIANFTFMVGVAAAAVMMVIPAYLYHDRDMHDAVIVGELLAIAAIVMCLLFVTVDLGRPDRFWHMMPGIGRFNWPISMLSWDVIVLNGYLGLNVWVCAYLLWCRYAGQEPSKRLYLPFVFISIFWAFSIHTVTAFLYQGLGGRPFWNTALLAPRFLASAFVAGPCFIIIALTVLQRLGDYPFGERPVQLLTRIVRIAALINLFMLASEIFTIFYGGGSHAAAMEYLLLGSHGHHALVPWMWSAIALNVCAAGLFCWPGLLERRGLLVTACIMTFTGVWIEKGMGLIIPAFVPSTLHEVVEYLPSTAEWTVMAGIWAAGLLVFTVLLKVAVPLLSGWTPGLAVGIAEVDRQHRELFRRLNNLVRRLRRGEADEVRRTMDYLLEYTASHFGEEEQFMASAGFPGLERHRALHAAFSSRVQELAQQLNAGGDGAQVAQELHFEVRQWLVEHIAHEDRGFGVWLRTRPQRSPSAVAKPH
jgi:molybdopterin-containing oxidoreductase family membrane subunit